ncbi:Rv3654c family TadE-like protein [Arthrobacter sp. GMC3]|uniref:Rv3654c family TadE-like protein n=1 Tax=Arthrobacter sp. GMC3 TaxID=2058894 RepID=UPI000CE50A44|nr:Rv3654c family TadE-like protein [Arthrobacter sp. GMC3]
MGEGVAQFRSAKPSCLGREEGAGTVLAAGLAMVLLTLLIGLMWLGQAVNMAAKAATSADLAALAAADAARGLTAGEPCPIAADLVGRQGGVLVSCEVVGKNADTVQIEVSVRTGLPWPAYGKSRAGPPPDSVAP